MFCTATEAISLLRKWKDQNARIIFGIVANGGENMEFVQNSQLVTIPGAQLSPGHILTVLISGKLMSVSETDFAVDTNDSTGRVRVSLADVIFDYEDARNVLPELQELFAAELEGQFADTQLQGILRNGLTWAIYPIL